MYYVYLIENDITKERYIGYASNIEKRLEKHNTGQNISTRRNIGKWIIVYYEAYRVEKDARNRENKLKQHGGGYRKLLDRLKESII